MRYVRRIWERGRMERGATGFILGGGEEVEDTDNRERGSATSSLAAVECSRRRRVCAFVCCDRPCLLGSSNCTRDGVDVCFESKQVSNRGALAGFIAGISRGGMKDGCFWEQGDKERVEEYLRSLATAIRHGISIRRLSSRGPDNVDISDGYQRHSWSLVLVLSDVPHMRPRSANPLVE